MTTTPVYSPTTASKPQLSCFRVPSEHLDKRRFGIKLCEVVSLEPRRSFCCCYKRGGPPERGPRTHHTQRAVLWTSPAPSSHWTPCRKFQRGSGTAACPLSPHGPHGPRSSADAFAWKEEVELSDPKQSNSSASPGLRWRSLSSTGHVTNVPVPGSLVSSCPWWPLSWRSWSVSASAAPPSTSLSWSAARPSSSRCCSSSSWPRPFTHG